MQFTNIRPSNVLFHITYLQGPMYCQIKKRRMVTNISRINKARGRSHNSPVNLVHEVTGYLSSQLGKLKTQSSFIKVGLI
jgi:hypothetical protein